MSVRLTKRGTYTCPKTHLYVESIPIASLFAGLEVELSRHDVEPSMAPEKLDVVQTLLQPILLGVTERIYQRGVPNINVL